MKRFRSISWVFICLLLISCSEEKSVSVVVGDPQVEVQGLSSANMQLENGEYTAQINGLKFWYQVSGSGPILIMPTPGWGVSAHKYINTTGGLTDDYTIVYFETRGSGRSEKPASTSEYRYADHASDLEGLRQILGLEKIILMGHSAGTAIATQYALDYPNRVEGLIHLAAYLEIDDQHFQWMGEYIQKRSHHPWFPEILKENQRTEFTDDKDFTDNVNKRLMMSFYDVKNYHDNWETFKLGTASVHAYEGWKDSEQTLAFYLDKVSQIQVPTTLIVGDDDFICPKQASERVHQKMSDSVLEVIPQAGHLPWMENFEAFKRALDGAVQRILQNS